MEVEKRMLVGMGVSHWERVGESVSLRVQMKEFIGRRVNSIGRCAGRASSYYF